MDIFSDIKAQARTLKDKSVAVMFSGGKDSMVVMDLVFKYFPRENIKVIHLYFVPNLEIKEKVLRWYEKHYRCDIIREPDAETINLINKGTGARKVRHGDQEFSLKQKYGVDYLASGARRQDSMARRGLLANLHHGIDERNGKIYPIADWTTKQVFAYIKANKLMMNPEYSMGEQHDFYIPDATGMLFLRNNFPEDYKKVIATFPQLEAMTRRIDFYAE